MRIESNNQQNLENVNAGDRLKGWLPSIMRDPHRWGSPAQRIAKGANANKV